MSAPEPPPGWAWCPCNGNPVGMDLGGHLLDCRECAGTGLVRARDAQGRFTPSDRDAS